MQLQEKRTICLYFEKAQRLPCSVALPEDSTQKKTQREEDPRNYFLTTNPSVGPTEGAKVVPCFLQEEKPCCC